MPRYIYRFVFALLTASIVVACSAGGKPGNSADDRVRAVLGISSEGQLSEAQVEEVLLKFFPLGTPESEISLRVREMGVGGGPYSYYHHVPKDNLAVVRFSLDPTQFGVVKSEWVITLQLNAEGKLQAVLPKRYLTGP